MKKSVILDIFNGDRGNIDSMRMPKENNESTKKTLAVFDEFKEKLSPELFNLYQKLEAALAERKLDEVDFFFIEGFKLGLRIGIECMEE